MTIHEFNLQKEEELQKSLEKCCGSKTWIFQMISHLPFNNKEEILMESDRIWNNCTEDDCLEAFQHHPKIGDINSLKEKYNQTKSWAKGEQSGVQEASENILQALSEGNKQYEVKFGFIFIVCATGKSAVEMLALLEQRLHNNYEKEIKIAMQEQGKITKIRLQKLIDS